MIQRFYRMVPCHNTPSSRVQAFVGNLQIAFVGRSYKDTHELGHPSPSGWRAVAANASQCSDSKVGAQGKFASFLSTSPNLALSNHS